MTGYVVKLTGSLFDEANWETLVSIADTARVARGRTRLLFVCGGGKLLRKWLSLLRREGGASEYDLDMLGIMFTRVNARIFSLLLKPDSVERIPETVEEAVELARSTDRHVVMGGVSPGFSTNAVAAFLARELGYSFINMTGAGGVYDKDPSVHSDAQLLRRVDMDRLAEILGSTSEHAGHYPLLDKTSLGIIKRYRVKTYIIPPDPESLGDVLSGREPRRGSIVTP